MQNGFKLLVWAVALLSGTGQVFAESESGPRAGDMLPPLKVHAVSGDMAGEVVDYTAKRVAKPTIYLFVSAKYFNRQTAQLLRGLDAQVANQVDEASIVAVWLTDEIQESKEFLQRMQASLQLGNTALTIYEGNSMGPSEWGLDSDAGVTVTLAHRGKAISSRGYLTADEMLVDQLLKALTDGVK